MTPAEAQSFRRLRSVMAALSAGPVLSAEDAAWLHASLRDWLDGANLEQAMSQPKKFRESYRIAEAGAVLVQQFPGAPAAELEASIKRYCSGEYRFHRKNGTAPVTGDRAAFHQFLTATGGKVRDKRTIQRWRKTTSAPHVDVALAQARCVHGKGTNTAKATGSRGLRSDRGAPR